MDLGTAGTGATTATSALTGASLSLQASAAAAGGNGEGGGAAALTRLWQRDPSVCARESTARERGGVAMQGTGWRRDSTSRPISH